MKVGQTIKNSYGTTFRNLGMTSPEAKNVLDLVRKGKFKVEKGNMHGAYEVSAEQFFAEMKGLKIWKVKSRRSLYTAIVNPMKASYLYFFINKA